ncbi:AAA domain-containing protein [Roseiconus nitratireducens]|uniref:AAA domain-containing protein n=1 Tax=Roseiconus nitratireducens TaxID=2605748 RepID=A0A5M6D439_9BACT|nr:AAA family ATPase [Roseiconus nitratireducens]KAA5542254.1 AAA domain-containing protein [Roseiconus nitratireducens]
MPTSTEHQTASAIEIREKLVAAETQINQVVVGQTELIRGMLISLICGGHVLIEGVPGLAKTTAVATLAATIRTSFCRLQFTPDLLPSDIIGSEIYRPADHRFEVQRGPIFANLVLVDEINRAPAKVQSALLEAMQERQVSIAGQTMPLPDPFMVLATQNPIDQQGTYVLPEAQMDRFLLKLHVEYPDAEAERAILHRSLHRDESPSATPAGSAPIEQTPVELAPNDLNVARQACAQVHVSDSLEQYILDLVRATRQPVEFSTELDGLIRFGVSPRGTLALAHAARARAFLDGQHHVTPDDVKAVILDAFRHRIVLSYEALAEDRTADDLLRDLIAKVNIP